MCNDNYSIVTANDVFAWCNRTGSNFIKYVIPKSVKLQLQNASQVLHHLQLQDFYCFTQWVKQELSLSESK